MRFGSLFAGIGGFDLGLERAGLSCAWQVERDKHCTRLLGSKWPGVERFDDVRTVAALPAVDLICGGFPCQDLSVAGRRAGMAGERSGLWREFHRILGIARPRWVIVENVPGLYSADDGRALAGIVSGLVELGYRVAWRCLDAQHFRLAQRRRRVFFVGSLGDGSAAEVLFESASMSGDPETNGAAGPEALARIEAGARGGRVAFSLRASDGRKGRGGVQIEDTLIPAVAWALQERDSKGVDSDTKDGHLIPFVGGVRMLTPIECERLQGFPDDWTAGFADGVRRRMLGNAVPVTVSEWIGRRIKEAA